MIGLEQLRGEAGSLVTNHMHNMYLRGGICQCLLLMLVSAAVVKPIDSHAWRFSFCCTTPRLHGPSTWNDVTTGMIIAI
jgi:hypothetical protein